ncbi:HlyC/CorC family transporter [Comamonas sp. NoAH]|uniref:HlyC/CorC family transporter n=1 Tax=Comamonas halotolerans TaxID=3041496 RepID=UPI0024E0780A|nr:transporter associated domain-containing protein [Comamonas sp. NoAH]
MSDPHPARHAEREDKRTFLQKIVEFIHPGLDSKDELIETLAEAEDNEVIGTEARVMLEGVIRMADRTASDIMVAAPRMDVLDIDAPYDELLVQVIRTAHSRFPVYEGGRDNIIGILMAKDLLKLQRSPTMSVRALLRPVTYVPETKGLYDLLREFRVNRNHMSILIDEFGNVAGLVTMEDVLEEIVGEIEDEFDVPEEDGDIFALADNTYRVAGHTPLERVEEAFNVVFPQEEGLDEFDTIGGWVSHAMGRLPKRGETLEAAGLSFTVLHAKGGAVRWFQVTRTNDGWLEGKAE